MQFHLPGAVLYVEGVAAVGAKGVHPHGVHWCLKGAERPDEWLHVTGITRESAMAIAAELACSDEVAALNWRPDVVGKVEPRGIGRKIAVWSRAKGAGQ